MNVRYKCKKKAAGEATRGRQVDVSVWLTC